MACMELTQNRGFAQKALRYFRDPSVATWRKLAGLFALLYFVMPVDVLPDIIPVLGWFDDVGVLSMAAMFMAKEIRRHGDKGQAPVPAEGRDARGAPITDADFESDEPLRASSPLPSSRRVSPVTGRPRR